MVENIRCCRLPKNRLRRCSHQNNSRCYCIVGNTNTSATTLKVFATLLNIYVELRWFRLDPKPILFAVPTRQTLHHRVPIFAIPSQPTYTLGHSAYDGTAFTQKRALSSHHSSPQQTWHFPFRCFGLHLSPMFPWIRPLSGDVCLASAPSDVDIALNIAVCTHRERFPLVLFSAKKSK